MKSYFFKSFFLVSLLSASLSSWGQSDLSFSKVKPQKEFAGEKAIQEYRDWQGRFKSDAKKFIAEVRNSKRVLTPDEVKQYFNQSISSAFDLEIFGEKGQREVRFSSPQFGDAVSLLIHMLTDTQTAAVGNGGIFKLKNGQMVEVWYVAFPLSKDVLQSAFPKYELPAYGKLQRNTFPIVFFQRNTNGQLLVAAFSKELIIVLEEAIKERVS